MILRWRLSLSNLDFCRVFYLLHIISYTHKDRTVKMSKYADGTAEYQQSHFDQGLYNL